jgi:hypothetical protein
MTIFPLFGTGVIDTCGKIAGGVIDTGGNLLSVSKNQRHLKQKNLVTLSILSYNLQLFTTEIAA